MHHQKLPGYRSLSKKMLLALLAFGALLVILVSALEIYQERNTRVAQRHNETRALVDANREPLALALWSFNQPEMEIIARSLVRSTSVFRVEVWDGSRLLLNVTDSGPARSTDLQWEIALLRPGGHEVLGHLRLFENYGYERARTFEYAIGLILGEIVKISILSLALLTLMHVWITGPMSRLANAVRDNAMTDADQLIHLPRTLHGRPDEIDALVTVLNFNITERARLEGEAILRQERSAQTSKLAGIGQLAGGVAHDFNNILGIISGYTELLLQDAADNPTMTGFLRKIAAASRRGRDLVKQILTFAKSDAAELVPIELAAFVRQSEGLVYSLMPQATQVSFAYEAAGLFIAGDSVQLGQLLLNLSVNARDALSGGAGSITVAVAAATDSELQRLHSLESRHAFHERLLGSVDPGQNYVRLSVADTGHGIAPEILDRIFEPFFSTRTRSRGTGLGLAVVHGVVTAHGGACHVQSRPGEGTVFSAYFPVIEARAASQAAPSAVAAQPVGSERLLVVDDEGDILDALSVGLQRLGYRVESFSDPVKALAAFRERPSQFDVLVTDQTMTALSGSELAVQAKALRPDLKVILSSGHAAESLRMECIDAFLPKPAAAMDIARCVRGLFATPG